MTNTITLTREFISLSNGQGGYLVDEIGEEYQAGDELPEDLAAKQPRIVVEADVETGVDGDGEKWAVVKTLRIDGADYKDIDVNDVFEAAGYGIWPDDLFDWAIKAAGVSTPTWED
jgi:hypothetical protein